MTKQIDELMGLADEYMVQERNGTNGFEARHALKQALEAALAGNESAYQRGYMDGRAKPIEAALKPGEDDEPYECHVCGELDPCTSCGDPHCGLIAPPAQTPPPRLKDTAVEACIKAVEDAFAWTGGHGEPSKPGPDAIANIIRSHFHVVQTPPRLTDDEIIEIANLGLWKSDSDITSDGLDIARAIETAVRRQFGYE